MKIGLISATVLIALLGSPAAFAGAVEDAVDEAREALKEVDDASRGCRSAVGKKLERVLRDMRGLGRRPSRSEVRSVEREVSDVLELAEEECPKGVRRKLERVLDALASASDDRDRDRDRRRDRRRDRDDEDEGRGRGRRVACWRDGDPGCEHTKGGNPPMSKAAFDGLLAAVRAQKPHVFPMLDTLRAGVSNQYLTSLQLSILLEEMKPHVHPMLDAVRAAAPRLVDPQNGIGISAQFKPHVFPAQEATQIISQQRAD